MGIDAFDLEVTPERGTPCALVAPCIAKEETNSFDTDILQFSGTSIHKTFQPDERFVRFG